MSIASAITDLRTRIDNVWTAVQGKGGTIPTEKTLVNLATAVTNLPSADYANEDALVARTNKTLYENNRVSSVGGYAFASSRFTTVTLDRCNQIAGYAFYAASNVKTLNLPSIITISANAFTSSGLTTINMPNKTMDQIGAMGSFPWGITSTTCKFVGSDGWIDKNKTQHPNT